MMQSTPIPLTFSTLSPATLEACAAIAASAPDPWSSTDLENAMQNLNCWSFVALSNGSAVGFACFLAVAGSADLQMIAVAPQVRRHGIARQLLQHSFVSLAEQGVQRCLLEVRESNLPAQRLYKKLGFRQLAVRPSMYHNPPENGLLMALPLSTIPNQNHSTEEIE